MIPMTLGGGDEAIDVEDEEDEDVEDEEDEDTVEGETFTLVEKEADGQTTHNNQPAPNTPAA